MASAHRHFPSGRPGVTLLEILVAIFIMGVGLLALLTLFPLGALSLARAVKDDRTAAFAADAQALSDRGEELLTRTRAFLVLSLVRGSADPKTAAELRTGYEDLATDATSLEARLRELRPQLPTPKTQAQADQLLTQLRAIEQITEAIADLLEMLEGGG